MRETPRNEQPRVVGSMMLASAAVWQPLRVESRQPLGSDISTTHFVRNTGCAMDGRVAEGGWVSRRAVSALSDGRWWHWYRSVADTMPTCLGNPSLACCRWTEREGLHDESKKMNTWGSVVEIDTTATCGSESCRSKKVPPTSRCQLSILTWNKTCPMPYIGKCDST
jgi:hypothetical protein